MYGARAVGFERRDRYPRPRRIPQHAGSIDAIDLARLAKQRGMRGLVLKSLRIDGRAGLHRPQGSARDRIFGGIDPLTVGGVNQPLSAHGAHEGRLGKVVWMPTFDNEKPGEVQ